MVRLALPLALALCVASAAGCASFGAARLYASGTRALDRGDAAAALRDLERAAALRPDASEIQNHLGLAYLEAGREGEARAAFERAVTLDCDNQAAHHNLGALGDGDLGALGDGDLGALGDGEPPAADPRPGEL